MPVPPDPKPDDDVTVIGRRPEVPTILGADLDPQTRLGAEEEPATVLGTPDEARTSLGSAPGSASGPMRGSPLEIGQAFGRRYHVIRLLGLGGMGAVYQAWDAELGTSVAIKVIRPEMAEGLGAAADLERRFKRELLLARKVTHKNVVRIHDMGEIDGIKYITMPFIEGEDLATVLKREGRLPVARVLRIARTAVAGLVAAHEAGIVHRDLKPANIMIGTDDEALIMDFGIARSTDTPVVPSAGAARPLILGPEQTDKTALGSVVGTLEYMAPEQARGLVVDQRADVYAFGLILSDMLLGRDRVKGPADTLPELQRRMAQAPPPPRSVDPSIPERIDRLVVRCLLPDPDERYQTTKELAAELELLDDAGVPRPVRRHVSPRLAAMAVAVVVAMLTGVWWLSRTPAAVQPQEPVSVLVADFVNRPQDPAFTGALEQTLGVAIEGASFITAYPRRDAQRVAAEIRPGTPFDEESARLVAIREGVKVVLAGTIEARGSGYTISVRVIDPSAAKPLTTATASASSKDAVLGAVGSLSARVRSALGDVEPSSGGAETLTSTSLDAVRDYSLAQDLANGGKDADAVALYQKAIGRDPTFGRAYSGLATSMFKLGRTPEAEAAWTKALSLMDRMTERERLRTQGTYFLGRQKNYAKAIDNFEQLVSRYPGDGPGHNNLAIAYFNALQFQKALAEGDSVRKIHPNKALYHGNYALYAMYAGDFAKAATEATALIEKDPKYFKAYLPLAVSALLDGRPDAARDAYVRMATADPARGASLAAIGNADQAMYEGRTSAAETLLKAGIKKDEEGTNTRALAAKLIALGEIYALTGRRALAESVASRALELSRDQRVPAAFVFLDAGNERKAAEIAAELADQLEPQSRAYGKIIEARIALKARKRVPAVEMLQEAIKLADLWTARYLLGIAYIEADHAPEAQAELELCEQRRGEATAVFLDDVPTLRVLVPLKYWLARAQEGVGQTAAAKANYQEFLVRRPAPADDPLVRDARKRVKALSK
jgi:tetratricopeptide (TPR) repeat protein